MKEKKYAAIIHNYNYPADRFNPDYAKPGENQLILKLIETAGKQGLVQGVEMNMDETDDASCVGINNRNWKTVRSTLDDNGIALIGIAPQLWGGIEFTRGTLGAADPKIRRLALDVVKRAIDLASEAGSPYINIWPGQDGYDYYFESDYQATYDWWVEGMRAAADHNPSIKLGLEPKPSEPRCYSFISTVPKSLMLARDIDRKNVGINIDTGHLLYAHENLAESVVLCQREGNRLFHLHLNDNYADADGDMMFASVHFLAYLEMFYWLRKTQYSGWKSLDLFPYRTNPAETIGEGVRWMMAFDDLIDEVGMDKFETLIKNGNAIENMTLFRKLLFRK
jgi:xylose isomerase